MADFDNVRIIPNVNPFFCTEDHKVLLRRDALSRLKYAIENNLVSLPKSNSTKYADVEQCRCAICLLGGMNYFRTLFGREMILSNWRLYQNNSWGYQQTQQDYIDTCAHFLKGWKSRYKKPVKSSMNGNWQLRQSNESLEYYLNTKKGMKENIYKKSNQLNLEPCKCLRCSTINMAGGWHLNPYWRKNSMTPHDHNLTIENLNIFYTRCVQVIDMP